MGSACRRTRSLGLLLCIIAAVWGAGPSLATEETTWQGQVHGFESSSEDDQDTGAGTELVLDVQATLDDGALYALGFGPDWTAPRPRPGSVITVSGKLEPAVNQADLPTIWVSSFSEEQPAPKVGPTTPSGKGGAIVKMTGAPPPKSTTQLSLLVVLLRFCGFNEEVAISPEDLTAAFFSQEPSIAGHFKYCAGGLDVLDPSRFKVVILDMPCPDGDTITYNLFSCKVPDFYAWTNYARVALKQQLGQEELDRYQHWGFVTPKGLREKATTPGCTSFVATAEVGPYALKGDGSYGFGAIWLWGGHATTMNVYLHELSHNLNLHHAGTATCEYCDATCAMGYCCRPKCHNAGHSMMLGWAGAGTQLRLADMEPGRRFEAALPPQQRQAARSLATVTDPQGMIWYLGFRQVHDTFDLVNEGDKYATHIYYSTPAMLLDNGADTIWLGRLSNAPGEQMYRDAGAGLVIRQLSWNAESGSVVSFCKQASGQQDSETSCFDGLDNDCDGLPDAADPDCAAAVRPVAAAPAVEEMLLTVEQQQLQEPSPDPSPQPSPDPPSPSPPSPQPPSPSPPSPSPFFAAPVTGPAAQLLNKASPPAQAGGDVGTGTGVNFGPAGRDASLGNSGAGSGVKKAGKDDKKKAKRQPGEKPKVVGIGAGRRLLRARGGGSGSGGNSRSGSGSGVWAEAGLLRA